MDRRRPRAQGLEHTNSTEARLLSPLAGRGGVLVVAFAVAAGAALAQGGSAPLRAERWLAAGVDPVRAMTRQPVECLTLPAGAEARLSVEVGRAAFRSPTVLGGQAARAGVACESCHRDGRTNRDFHFPGVSGPPGTADVTSSLFSTHRGDDIFNPKPIPDLGGPKAALKIDQDRTAAALEPFIDGLVTQEFDGPEPSAAVLKGLADYVRALSPDACPKAADAPVRLAGVTSDARRALEAAEALTAQGDRASAEVMVQAARARLFLVDERYADPALSADRERLRAADRRLAGVLEALRQGASDAGAEIAKARAALGPLEAALTRHEARSLFDPARMAKATERRLLQRTS